MNEYAPIDLQEEANGKDDLYTRIRVKIIEGELQPGQQLKQSDLAENFGISRSPVRDALKRLAAEGLISIVSTRYAVVTQLDLRDIQETYRIRCALEQVAVREAAEKITEHELTGLEHLLARMEALSHQHMDEWLKLDYLFHKQMMAPCGQKRLLRLIDNLWDSTRRIYFASHDRIRHAETMHRRLMRSLRDHDGDLTSVLIRAHIEDVVRWIIEDHMRRDAHAVT